jgi:hypothetical protein
VTIPALPAAGGIIIITKKVGARHKTANERVHANARNLDKSDLHPGPDVLQRHRCDAEHDDGQWNERLGVERQFGWRQFERRSRRRWAVCPQRPMWAMVCPWMPGVNATERRVGLQRQSPVPFSGLPERRSGSRRGAGLLIPPHHR